MGLRFNVPKERLINLGVFRSYMELRGYYPNSGESDGEEHGTLNDN